MLTLKHWLFGFLAICVIALPIGILTIADDTPGPITIETSYGITFTITDVTDAEVKWNTHESYLRDAKERMRDRKEERNIIEKGYNGDKSGLEAAALPVVVATVQSKRPDAAAVILLAKEILEDLNKGRTFEIAVKLINKYSEIDALNREITNDISDRNKFHEALAAFEGRTRPYQVKDTLDEMLVAIPLIYLGCSGGGCGDWYYDVRNIEYYSGITIGGKYGIPLPLSLITMRATNHQTSCAGCSESYWTCREKELKEHQQLYCGKDITWYTYDSLSGKWGTFSLGVCGATYRRCDDPKKTAVHHYRPVMLSGEDSWGNSGYYISSYRADPPTAHSGNTSAAGSINGPAGSGIPAGRMDNSPNCDSCMDGSRFCPEASTKHQGGQANNNGGGFGNTLNAACLDDDCTTTITSSNASEHALVTCEACGVQYHKCNENDVYAHAYVTCSHPNCPRKGGTGSTNLYGKYRCQGNPPNTRFSCIDGRPHAFGGEAPENAPPATVPDRPGSFALTPHRYAIRLTWTSSASNGGSAITDYQYQYQSSRTSRRTWSSWSSWTSAGTGNSTWINGLSSGVDYGIRMRAVNAVGNSVKTGIKIVKTTE